MSTYKYFVEDRDTHEWIQAIESEEPFYSFGGQILGSCPSLEFVWTNAPTFACNFYSMEGAEKFIKEFSWKWPERKMIATEHEFPEIKLPLTPKIKGY